MFSVQLAGMRPTATTGGHSSTPGEAIRRTKAGSFVHVARLPGTALAANSAASRAARDGFLVHCRHGLYYKGFSSQFGMTRPRPIDVAMEVLGTDGVGPAGFSAAHALGLTTQLAAIPELVTVHAPPVVEGVRVRKRNNVRRVGLTFDEIALFEVLRDPETLVEGGWTSLIVRVATLIAAGRLRLRRLAMAVSKEVAMVRLGFALLTAELAKAGQG